MKKDKLVKRLTEIWQGLAGTDLKKLTYRQRVKNAVYDLNDIINKLEGHRKIKINFDKKY